MLCLLKIFADCLKRHKGQMINDNADVIEISHIPNTLILEFIKIIFTATVTARGILK